MATTISWCDEVWNPVVGCKRVSSGCDNCYAFSLHGRRYAANLEVANALVGTGAARGDERIPYAREHGSTLPFPAQYDQPFSQVQLLPDRLAQPLHWRKPRRVFVTSMGDLFHEDVPDEFISHVFAVMSMATQHEFLILTKRPERMRSYLQEMASDPDAYVWAWAHEASNTFLDGADHPPPAEYWPLPNVWLGVSVENQETADERTPKLLKTPAAVRWISAEPLLGPVDLRCISHVPEERYGYKHVSVDALSGTWTFREKPSVVQRDRPHLDWVVVGGESGPHARPMDHAWVQQIRNQCRDAGVAFFFKQASGPRPGQPIGDPALDGCKEYPR